MRSSCYCAVWIVLAVAVSLTTSSWVEAKEPPQDPFKHAFANPVDQPGLPRVLIIGDSISIGYTPYVRELLKGKANVHRPVTNCRWSAFGAEHVDQWVGDSQWDVVHFNFGLWDWYGWRQQSKATPQSYATHLESIVKRLKKTGARVIFATTTPPCIAAERNAKIVVTQEQAAKFRAAALTVMKKHGVSVNDLHAAIGEKRAKYQLAANDVHYNTAGRKLLAAKVAQAIETQIPAKALQP